MDTFKISFVIEPYESWVAELLMTNLAETGYDSFVETETGLEAYISSGKFDRTTLESCLSEWNDKFSVRWQQESIADRNWNEEWEKNYFQPLVIKDRLLVRAPFHTNFPQYEIEIVIEPKMAFGTGNHETTALMMGTMTDLSFSGKKVLDMGCGTGILAILASKLGAASLTAIDNDTWSFNATTENITINQCGNIRPVLGDASCLGSEIFDIILVNIHKNVIIQDIRTYASVLASRGWFMCSGFFEEDLKDIEEAAKVCGLRLYSTSTRNHWMLGLFLRE